MTDYRIASAPTILPGIFRNALAHRNSPVMWLADEAFNLCTEWGVNPAVALGFFVHESNAGTQGAAVATRNWGNLRAGPGEIDQTSGFARYASWLVGLNDFCKLLRGPLYEGAGLLTVSQVTPRYAPSADANDPTAYASAVNALCATWESLGV